MLQVVLGGVMIGLASALLMASNGRIAGISSIVHRAFFFEVKNPGRFGLCWVDARPGWAASIRMANATQY